MKSFVLMTAMPPTRGHFDLIRFATNLAPETVVIVCTQPGEPYCNERVEALMEATRERLRDAIVRVVNIHKTLPQEPEGNPGFWDMWAGFLESNGFQAGDRIVASESYGMELAKHVDGEFFPYDIDRSIRYTKATQVRNSPSEFFQDILPEFRTFLMRTVTVFGAESVGKTTTARYLAAQLHGKFLFEWARPYLEAVGPEVTEQKMSAIVDGQQALHYSAVYDLDEDAPEYIIQDTDLFSTLGYWKMWSPDTVPFDLALKARLQRSDLYIIMSSEIDFEPDPLRYGGDVREAEDQYWIDICEAYELPYVYITGKLNRFDAALQAVKEHFSENSLKYQREGKEYE